jgi:dihydroneopterin aldolase
MTDNQRVPLVRGLVSMLPSDQIRIEDLELTASIGVTDAERSQPQRLSVSLVLEPRHSFDAVKDDLSRTIDYAVVCSALRQFAAQRQVRLIETLANEMAALLIREFDVRRLELELRKFVLPETRHVAVHLVRERSDRLA